MLVASTNSMAYTPNKDANHGSSLQSSASVMLIAKGQYYNDARTYKPGVNCRIC